MRLVENLKNALTISRVNTAGIEQDGGTVWYPLSGSFDGRDESIDDAFVSYVSRAYKANGIVFACVGARLLAFSEARFQFQRFNNGRPGDLWGDESLSLLENPWPNGTTGELLARMEQDASLAGNFYATTVGAGPTKRIRRLRPDWVTIMSGVRDDPDAGPYELESEVLAYFYSPGGKPDRTVLLSTDRVVHYSPIPDPDHQWRGMSWLTPILNEITADSAMTRHRNKFFKNGAQSSLVVTYDPNTNPDLFQRSVALFNEQHKGEANAYKTIHLGGGADAKVLTTDLKSIDFKAVQGGGETRIAAAAGVGAIIARLSEGMQGSSLNAGNYGAAKRQFADLTIRPLWRTAAASLAKLVGVPAGSRLWYDSRDVAFLAEDEKDEAEILSKNAATVKSLVDAGYTPESVIAAVNAGDLSLCKHSGFYSVQLRPPGEMDESAAN